MRLALVAVAMTACVGRVEDVPGVNQRACENAATGVDVELGFVNRFTDRRLEVSWTDEACVPQLIATLSPQTFINQRTLSGDAWRVRDADTGEVLFEGRAPPEATVLVFPTTDTRVCSSLGREARQVNFKNRYDDRALSLFWVDAACREHAAGEIAPRTHLTVDTVVGHVFRFRRAGTETLVEDAAPITATTTLVWAPSDGSAPACSELGDTASVVGFVNGSTADVRVFWVDYQCREVLAGTVAAGQSLYQSSFFTHVFRVRSADGGVIASPPPLSAPMVTVTVP